MKKAILLLIAVSIFALAVSPVRAETGTIRIEPHGSYYPQPIMLTSPALFNISVMPSGNSTEDPHILLVMSNASYYGLIDSVNISWTGGETSFLSSDFISVDSGYIPPSGTTPGVRYQVSSLRDHLQVPNTEPVWYAFGPFLSGPITQTNQTFTIAANSTSLRMLVYALGKTGGSDVFNNRVPPTRAGFVVPDPGIILATLASFGAFATFAIYRIKRRKQ